MAKSKKELVLEYFKKDFEEDDGTAYYIMKPGYCCFFNAQVPITLIQIEADGSTVVSSDSSDSEPFTEREWNLVSVHSMTEVLGATK